MIRNILNFSNLNILLNYFTQPNGQRITLLPLSTQTLVVMPHIPHPHDRTRRRCRWHQLLKIGHSQLALQLKKKYQSHDQSSPLKQKSRTQSHSHQTHLKITQRTPCFHLKGRKPPNLTPPTQRRNQLPQGLTQTWKGKKWRIHPTRRKGVQD